MLTNNIRLILITLFGFGYSFCYDYKIAFVKQVVYQDLYCCGPDSSIPELIFSSFKRSGPVALFTKLNADFYIVDTEPDRECQIWKEKAEKRTADYELLRTDIPARGIIAGHKHPQGYYAVKASDIDWGQYDIVIAMECAIPARITKKYPSTLWAYYIGEGCRAFQQSLNVPIEGYDCYLYPNFSVNPKNKSHVIEFPYHLQYYGCFHELLGMVPGSEKRSGIYFEHHTGLLHLSNEQKNELNSISSIFNKSGESYNSLISLKKMIQDMMQTKYFVIYLEKNAGKRASLLGNAIPEAIAAGNLVVAKDFGIANKSLFTSRTLVNDYSELQNCIEYFEKNPKEYLKEVEAQRRKLNFYCFERPVTNLYKFCDIKKLNKLAKINGQPNDSSS